MSGRHTNGLTRDPNDLDLDGYPNANELLAGSDPTFRDSTPFDRDADGKSNPGGAAKGPVDPCDFDHRIPALGNIVLRIERLTGAEATSATRGETLRLVAFLTDGQGLPRTNDTGFLPTVSLTVPATAFEPEMPAANDVQLQPDATLGRYSQTFTIEAGNRTARGDGATEASAWILKATAMMSGEVRVSEPKTLSVAPRTFTNLLTLNRPDGTYFNGDSLTITATPAAGQSVGMGQMSFRVFDKDNRAIPRTDSGATTDKVNSATGANGGPVLLPAESRPMTWNAGLGAWVGTLSIGELVDAKLLTVANQGQWRIEVNGRDGASTHNTATAAGISFQARALTRAFVSVALDGTQSQFLRNEPIAVRVQVFDDGVPGIGHTVELNSFVATPFPLNLLPDSRTTETGVSAPLSDDDGDGIYTGLITFPIDSKTGRYHLVAKIGTSVRDGNAFARVDIVERKDLAITVVTDKLTYSGAQPITIGGMGPAPPAPVPPTNVPPPPAHPEPPTPPSDPPQPPPPPQTVPTAPPMPPEPPADPTDSTAMGAWQTAMQNYFTVELAAYVQGLPPSIYAMQVVTWSSEVSTWAASVQAYPGQLTTWQALMAAYVSNDLPPYVSSLPQGAYPGQVITWGNAMLAWALGEGSGSPDSQIMIGAHPNGVAGTHFANPDAASPGGEAPGRATYSIFTFESIPIALDQPMEWKPGNAFIPDRAHFEASYPLGAQHALLAGTWRIIVKYEDDAPVKRNVGTSGTTVTVSGPSASAPLPPLVSISTVNGVSNDESTPIKLEQRFWRVEGEYRFRSGDSDPVKAANVNRIWVRVAGGPWRLVPATNLVPSTTSGTGAWHYDIDSQLVEGISTSGSRLVEAVAAYDPGCDAGRCILTSPDDPNGLALARGPPFTIVSSPARAIVALTFPAKPVPVIEGIRYSATDPVTNLMRNGKQFTLVGRVDLNTHPSSNLSKILIDMDRVVFANCVDPDVSTVTNNHDAREWCKREALLGSVDLLAPATGLPSSRIRFVNTTSTVAWELDVDLSDPYFTSRGITSLTRRVNIEFEQPLVSTATNPSDRGDTGALLGTRFYRPDITGSGSSQVVIPEALENMDQPTKLTFWERSQSAFGGVFYVGVSQYWAKSTVVLNTGFQFSNTLPATHKDLFVPSTPIDPALGSNGLDARGCGTGPVPFPHDPFAPCNDGRGASASITAASMAGGSIPGHTGLNMVFPDYPLGRITEIRSVYNNSLSYPVTSSLFRIHHLNADATDPHPLRIGGTIDNKGNDVQKVEIVIYKVRNVNCIDDTRASNSGGLGGDSGREWCARSTGEDGYTIQRLDITNMNVFGANFNAPYDASWRNATPQTFLAPFDAQFLQVSISDGHAYFVTTAITTTDGDIIEQLPPIAEHQSFYSVMTNPQSGSYRYRAPTSTNTGADNGNVISFSSKYASIYNLVRLFDNPAPSIVSTNVQPFPNGQLSGFPNAAYLVPTTPIHALDKIANLSMPRFVDGVLVDTGARTSFEWTPSAGAPFTYPFGLSKNRDTIGAVHTDRLRLFGNSSELAYHGDISKINLVLQYSAFDRTTAGGITNTLVFGTGSTIAPAIVYSIDVQGTSAPKPPGVLDYSIERSAAPAINTQWEFLLDTSKLLENTGPSAAALAALTGRNYGTWILSVEVEGIGGLKTTITRHVLTDRDSSPDVRVDRMEREEPNQIENPDVSLLNQLAGNFEPATRDIPVGSADRSFVLRGNNKIRFNVTDDHGVAFLEPGQLDGRIRDVDFAAGLVGPQFDWDLLSPLMPHSGTRNINQCVNEQGASICAESFTLAKDGFYLDAPMVIPCPPGGLVNCAFPTTTSPDDDPNLLTTGRISFFMPMRVGFDPVFVRICTTEGNMFNPERWTLCPDPIDPNERAGGIDQDVFRPDTQKNFHWDGCGNARWSTGVSSTLTLFTCGDGHGAGVNSLFGTHVHFGPDGTSPYVGNSINSRGNKDGTSSSRSGVIAAGVDEGYIAACTESPSADTCTYDPYTPFDQQDPTNFNKGDDWWKCLGTNINQGFGVTGRVSNDRCDTMSGLQPETAALDRLHCLTGCYTDETSREVYYLINRNTPLFFWGSHITLNSACTDDDVDTNAVDCSSATAYQSGAGDDFSQPGDSGPYTGPDSFNLFRGFGWQRPQPAAVSVVDQSLLFDLRQFENTVDLRKFVGGQLNPDYGKMLVPDGKYEFYIRAIDNTTSLSELDYPGEIPNNDGQIVKFTFVLNNDRDDDGVSDFREDFLRQAVRDGTMRSTFVPGGSFYADRYRDRDSKFPNSSDARSTESDWDGDGIPNKQILLVPNPVTGGAQEFEVDYELLLGSDPLTPDFPGIPLDPAACSLGQPSGSGSFGDRNGNCHPNINDDKRIFRPNSEQGAGLPGRQYIDFITEVAGGLAATNSAVCSQLTGPCAHPVQVNLTGHPSIAHVYVDFAPSGGGSLFSIGTHTHDGNHQELMGSATAAQTIQMVRGLIDGSICVMNCGTGHTLQVNGTAGSGIQHVYVNINADARTASVGVHGASEQELIGTTTVNQAIQTALGLIGNLACATNCPSGHTVRINTTSGGYVYVKAAGTGFSVGMGNNGQDQELVGSSTLGGAFETARALAASVSCAKALTPSCPHTLTFNTTSGNHLYIDASGSTFSVGLHQGSTHGEIIGSQSLSDAVVSVLTLVQATVCVDCPSGHKVKITTNTAPVNYIYVKHNPSNNQFAVGASISGQEQDLAGSATVDAAVQLAIQTAALIIGMASGAGDVDGDRYTNDRETTSGTNPFHRNSNPLNRGAGFPYDWDGDGYTNERELTGGSDPMNHCSTPLNRGAGISPTLWRESAMGTGGC